MVYLLDKEIHIGKQKCKFTHNIGYKELMETVTLLSDVLIIEEELTGTPIVDVLNYKPVTLFHICKHYTDLDLSVYEDMYRLVDDIFDSEDAQDVVNIYNEVTRLYAEERTRKEQEIRDRNSVQGMLKVLGRNLMGTDDGKNVGMIRTMLTDIFIKLNRESNDQGPTAPKVNMSAYKAKK